MTFRTLSPLLLVSALLASACGGSQHADSGGALQIQRPQEMDDLVPRERETVERLLDEQIAPCPDQAVPISTCLDEKRSCKACEPAARFITERVKAGLGRADAARAYEIRFGNKVTTVDVAGSPTKGSATAPVTIMVWSDFECPACRRIVPIVERVAAAHENDVRLVHKFYPLPRHTHAEVAARAAYAAQKQGRYWEMEHELFENQDKLGDATIGELAEELGLDMGKLRADMQSEAATKTIERDKADADRAGLMGTPFILINGREFDLGLFKPEPDLDAWVSMEIELARGR
ncbi:DsbA family protein [Polyangium jinanense]|uniref:Thioredoxin domain-containing protein n=1 Tax=Polyangium jinanense TaxID=2829994 RepID=A0A9X3XD47_9BACT|nr:thioredoxin domain-containing protein [Polyangium jinanense]MDC3956829.1 thioredoxin domain-containing protein [Polyangium jinanense]MDC3987175.1 thioredoxin domain-containing protein [Polyangium jinanense]